MATTIGQVVSRLRNVIKAVKEDSFITDRFLYSVVLKYGKALIRRQDNENKIKMARGLFKKVPCYELTEVDKIEACCSGIKSNCTIMKTSNRLPAIMEGSYGPIIRGVSSIDDSTFAQPTTPQLYVSIANSTNFKYNKTVYYWFLDGYIYLPNSTWEAVNIEAMWEDSVYDLQCNSDNKCVRKQDESCPIPEYLFAEAEGMTLKEFGITMQATNENSDDKQSNLR